jgi:cytoskeletal protein CcmA (bactofilin family)
MAKDKDKPMGNTIIGSSIVVDGEISGEEPLTILGTVKGKIAVAQNLNVESGANVEANVEAQALTVSGRLTGNVHARERVELRADAKMVGDVKSPRIVIADGASFKGNVDMDV